MCYTVSGHIHAEVAPMLWDIGIELGSGAVRMATREQGLCFAAPSHGALREGKLVAIGEEALDMLGRTPPGVEVCKPVREGVIAEPRLVGQWLTRLLRPFVNGSRVTRPQVVILDNGYMRQNEKDTIVAAVMEMGAGRCGLLSADLAAAAGAGCDLRVPEGTGLVNLGADTLGACLIAGGRVMNAVRRPFGMSGATEELIRLLRCEEGLAVGPRSAEDLKIGLSDALPVRDAAAQISGLDMATGFPGGRAVSSRMVYRALEPVIDALFGCCLELGQRVSEELCADLNDRGLVLTGGGAALAGLGQAVEQRLGLKCIVPETPSLCTGKGMARILQDEELSDLTVRPV